MSLLTKLKSLLGMEREEGARGNVEVTVERESRPEPDAETERAVKESVEDEAGESEAEPDESEAEGEAEPEVSGPADEAEPASDSEVDAEPAADTEPVDEEPETEPEAEAEPDVEGAEAEPDVEGAEAEPEAEPEADLEDLKGVGPAYAGRLREAGYGSVADLAEADPDEVAAATDLSPARVSKWIEQAKARRR